jgi:hypothetical protein
VTDYEVNLRTKIESEELVTHKVSHLDRSVMGTGKDHI